MWISGFPVRSVPTVPWLEAKVKLDWNSVKLLVVTFPGYQIPELPLLFSSSWCLQRENMAVTINSLSSVQCNAYIHFLCICFRRDDLQPADFCLLIDCCCHCCWLAVLLICMLISVWKLVHDWCHYLFRIFHSFVLQSHCRQNHCAHLRRWLFFSAVLTQHEPLLKRKVVQFLNLETNQLSGK